MATRIADIRISSGMNTTSFFQVGHDPNRASTTRDQCSKRAESSELAKITLRRDAHPLARRQGGFSP